MFYITAMRLATLLLFLDLREDVHIPSEHGYTKEQVDIVANVVYGERAHLVDRPTRASIALVHAMLNGQKEWDGSLRFLAETRWHGYNPEVVPPPWVAERAELALILYEMGYDYANGAVYVLSWHDLNNYGKLSARENACFVFGGEPYGFYGFRKEDWPL